MADNQSTDGSLYSRESDDEKSLESNEDMVSMITDTPQEQNDNGNDNDNDNDNGDSKNDNDKYNGNDNDQNNYDRKSDLGMDNVGTSDRTADTSKNSENADDEDDKTDDETDKGNASETKIKKFPYKKNLNEGTLTAIEKYLKSGDFFNDTLEYEEIAAFVSKIHRYAIERTRGRQGVLFRDGNIQNGDSVKGDIDPIIITKEDAAEERLYNQIYQKEEFHAVATDFSKTISEGALNTTEPNLIWHTKTANWLKRAAGMQRHYDPYEKGENQKIQQHNNGPTIHSDDSDEGEGEIAMGIDGGGGDTAPTRVTRRRVQMTRKKRRQERFEKETETFRILSEVTLEFAKQPRAGRTKKGVITIDDATDDEGSDVEILDPNSEEVNRQALRPFPTLDSTGLPQIYQQHYSHLIDIAKYPGAVLKEEDGVESKEKILERVLPPAIARCGCEFRPQSLELEEVGRNLRKVQQGMDSNKTRDRQTTDRFYARKSKALMNVLSNRRARNWAIHEFFYNDIDREWYQNDGFISDLVKLGLPINSNTRLTKQEWSLVRRKIRPRPRLFSKPFIAEQLKRRNRHRALVRRLQQDPGVTEFSPISVGTIVTAYHKQGSTMGKGRVLLHDSKTHNYLIQFNDKILGCEVCPDSEVAVSLATKTTTKKVFSPQLYKPCKAFSSEASRGVGTELAFAKDITCDGHGDEIERELLISVIAVITEAFDRKKNILEALETCATDTVVHTSKHSSWLLANLDQINITLEAALIHLQVLYGSLYGSPVSNTEVPKSEGAKMSLSKDIPETKEFEEFMASLTSVSDKIGEFALPSGGGRNNLSSKSLQNDLSGSANLLLLTNYLAETSSSLSASETNKTGYSSAMNAALKSSLDNYANSCLPSTSEALLVGKRLEEESQIEDEMKGLGLAVGMLRAEVAIAADENRIFELNTALG